MFDDLGPSLIKVSNPDLQFQLLCSFLQFLGIPCGYQLLPSFLYVAMDENNIFGHGQDKQSPLTSFDLPLSGVSTIGQMDSVTKGRRRVGHSKEGEEFIQNFFHMMLPLFSGEEKSKLYIYWLQYEIAKVIHGFSSKLCYADRTHILQLYTHIVVSALLNESLQADFRPLMESVREGGA